VLADVLAINAMYRLPAFEFWPRSMLILGAVPFVQAMLTEPLAFSGDVALACSDSYKPKLNAVALIRQFPATAAETPSTAVDPVARGMATSITAAASAVAHALRQLRSRRSRGMSIPPRGNA